MNLTRNIVIALIIIGISSCKKKVENVNPNMIGFWTAEIDGVNYELDIKDGEESTFLKYWTNTTEEYDAEVKASGIARIRVKNRDNDLLKVGKKEFTIGEYPDEEVEGELKYPKYIDGADAHWELSLNGILYRRD